MNYVYSFTQVLASPDPRADFDVVKMWGYARNGIHVISGTNMLNVLMEILFFFKVYGNPVDGDKFITAALQTMKVHQSLLRGIFLIGWVEDRIISLPPEDVITMLESVTKSGTYAILRTFLSVLDNCGQLAARLPQSVFQPCYKFMGNNDKPCTICDVYNMCMSSQYYRALNKLVTYVQRPRTPLLGTNQINDQEHWTITAQVHQLRPS